MPSSNESWGIEVGAHEIKAIHLVKSGKTGVAVANYEVIPHKKVLTTPDVNAEESIRLSLGQLASKHSFGKASVAVSVPGYMAFARFAKLPPVEPKKVPDIVRFEAVQQIPFPIDQVEWDYQIFANNDTPEVEVGIFAITKEKVNEWLAHFTAAGIPVHGVTLCPLAAYNAMAYDRDLGPDSPGTLFIDIGTNTTDLIVCQQGNVWLRTLPIGGHQFTEALVRAFKLPYSKAEKLKKEAATSKYARQLFQAMRPVFTDLVNEVQKSLNYYQSQNPDSSIKKAVGLGSTFALPGLRKFLSQQLQIEVGKLEGFKKIAVEGKDAAAFAEHAGVMAQAYGLALQGLELEQVSATLMPKQIITRELWKKKTIWMAASAAVVVVAATLPMVSLVRAQGAYRSGESLRGQIKQAISLAESKKSEWAKAQGDDPRLQIENYRRLNDYTELYPLLWLDTQQALAAAEPQPDLLTGDPEKIKAIKRGERRTIQVNALRFDYVFGQRAASSGPEMRTGGPTGSDSSTESLSADAIAIWGEYKEGEPGFVLPQPPPKEGETASGDSSSSDSSKPPAPRIRVYATLTTPYKAGTTFVMETFVKWLRENEVRVDRPYRIHVPSVPIISFAQVKNAGGTGGRPARSGGAFPGSPGAFPRPGSGANPFGGVGTFNPNPSRPGATRPGQPNQPLLPGQVQRDPSGLPSVNQLDPTKPEDAVIRDFNSYMPQDPLLVAEEKEAGDDWQIEIQWEIELARPEWSRYIRSADQADLESLQKKWEALAKGEPETPDGEGEGGGDATPEDGQEPPAEGNEAASPARNQEDPQS